MESRCLTNCHPSIRTPQQVAEEKFQTFWQLALQTLVGLAVRADEVEDDLNVVFSRCHHIQRNEACSTTCPMWDGKECLAKKWKEQMADLGWSKDVLDELTGLMMMKKEQEVVVDEVKS